MFPSRFRSLRYRLLIPLLVVALLTACGVAAASYWLGGRRTENELNNRFQEIAASLSDTSFPLTSPVLTLLADLTQTELLIASDEGRLLNASVALEREQAAGIERQLRNWQENAASHSISLGQRVYRVMRFRRAAARQATGQQIIILFDQQDLRATRWRIAALPLVTGLTTTILLATITLAMTSRLIGRLSQLERQVDRIATGAFDTAIAAGPHDEVGMLGASVGRMAAQLKQLWERVHRQQGQKLLHQIASGMAHQLRNSLTGARMAVELHAESCQESSDKGLQVAVQQIEQSENFVRRLLQVGAGQQDRERPATALQCLRDVRASSASIATHRHRNMQWQLDEQLSEWMVADGSAFTAAITNLVLNALEAGERVEIETALDDVDRATGRLTVRITDNGPGVPAAVGDQLFEPFVTSKQEGLGLGLAVVKRAAEKLEGDVQYGRTTDRTTFRLTVQVTRKETP